MPEPLPILRNRLEGLRDSAMEFFSKVAASRGTIMKEREALSDYEQMLLSTHPARTPRQFQVEGMAQEVIVMRAEIRRTMVSIADAMRRSPLVGEADILDLAKHSRTMDCALFFRRYEQWNMQVHTDEGDIVGTQPAGQSENDVSTIDEARNLFNTAYSAISALLDYWSPDASRESAQISGAAKSTLRTYRENTAFIMMRIDASDSSSNDVRQTVHEVFKKFNIVATRADEIEHEGKITDRVIEEISTSEFLFADLTGERPSVYYEVDMRTRSESARFCITERGRLFTLICEITTAPSMTVLPTCVISSRRG